MGEGNPSANARGIPLPHTPTPPQRVLKRLIFEKDKTRSGGYSVARPELNGKTAFFFRATTSRMD